MKSKNEVDQIAQNQDDEGLVAVHEALEPTDIAEMQLIERLFFAYRDFVHEPDAILQRDNFGRSHHRILHFVNRHPGMSVTTLLDILKITKQSMAPSLRQMIDQGYILQEVSKEDRRKRLLFPTPKGRELMLALCEPQSKRMQKAMAGLSSSDRDAVLAFLLGVVSDDDQQSVQELTDH